MPLHPQVNALLESMRSTGGPPLEATTVEQARAAQRASTVSLGGPVEEVSATVEASAPSPAGEVPVRIHRPRGAPAGQPLGGVVYLHGGGWVAGDSAGGNLAAVIARRDRDAGGAPPLRLQLLVYPITDGAMDTPSYTENGEGHYLTRADMRWYWGHYLAGADPLQPDASPLRATDLRGLPPAWVLTAEYDPLRDEGEAYAESLCAAGVPVACQRRAGMVHGFVRWAGAVDDAAAVLDEAAAALREALEPR
jgi:acetyl esterase/lipase